MLAQSSGVPSSPIDGMPTAFSTGADFSGIADIRPLFLKKVLQEAFVNVDEVGTEAAAVTPVVAATVSLTGVAARGRKKAANP